MICIHYHPIRSVMKAFLLVAVIALLVALVSAKTQYSPFPVRLLCHTRIYTSLLHVCIAYLTSLTVSLLQITINTYTDTDIGFGHGRVYPLADEKNADMFIRIKLSVPSNMTASKLQFTTGHTYQTVLPVDQMTCLMYLFSDQSHKHTLPISVKYDPTTAATTLTTVFEDIIPAKLRDDLAIFDCKNFRSPKADPIVDVSEVFIDGLPVARPKLPEFPYTTLDSWSVATSSQVHNATDVVFKYKFTTTLAQPGSTYMNVYDFTYLSDFYVFDQPVSCKTDRGVLVDAKITNYMLHFQYPLDPMSTTVDVSVECIYAQPALVGKYGKKLYMGTDTDERFAGSYLTETIE